MIISDYFMPNGDAQSLLTRLRSTYATENIPPPLANIERVAAKRDLRIVPVPSPILGFLLFNQRDPRDRDRPHPILSELDVRRAIGLALDRRLMVRSTFGNAGDVPYGPASPILWIRHGAPQPLRANPSEARRLLVEQLRPSALSFRKYEVHFKPNQRVSSWKTLRSMHKSS